MRNLFLCVAVALAVFLAGTVDLQSQKYKKKATKYHSIGANLGLLSISSDRMGERYNPGTYLSAGYIYTKNALMYSGFFSYATFPEYEGDGFKSNLTDISIVGGIYWNILQNNFYDGITPFIGIEGGLTFYSENAEAEMTDETFTDRYIFSNIGPVIGTSVPLTETLAFIVKGRYKVTWLNASTGTDEFGNSTSVSIATDYNYFLFNVGLQINVF